MGEEANRQAVERLFQADGGDVEGFHDEFHEDSVITFPQSGERIVGEASCRATYRSFPGRPSDPRIVTGGHLAVAEATIDYGDGVDWRGVFVFELRDGKIAKLTAYWAQPFAPSEARAGVSTQADQ